MKRFEKGFSLIELMIVIAILALMLTLCYSSYAGFIRKGNRTEAQSTLLDWANRQEIWRADHPGYSTGIDPLDTEMYEYSMVSTASSFTLTATALGAQAADQEDGVSCGGMTYDHAGAMGPAGHEKCWAR